MFRLKKMSISSCDRLQAVQINNKKCVYLFVENFEFDMLSDGEKGNVLKDRGDVFTRLGVCEQTSSRVLNVLQLILGAAVVQR